MLKKLAEATGGRMLEVKGMHKLSAALVEISDELHHQYSLGYYPENQNWDGKYRKIQIVTHQRGYEVYARKGYYAHPRYQAMRQEDTFVREAEQCTLFNLAAIHLREEPDALTSARPDLCGGYQ